MIKLSFLLILLYGCQYQNDNFIIEYEASSRGFYLNVKIEDHSIITKNFRDEEGVRTIMTEKQISEFDSIINQLEYVKLSELNPPSDGRFTDRAAIAYLKVSDNKSSYTTKMFDHGNPPKEIEAFVRSILSMAGIE